MVDEPLTVSRALRLPDAIRIARSRRAPELGPRILFFSGGSALRGLSRHLKRFTHNSVHLITPFDSGGSSARLREAFSMLSVGDVRNRLLALADETVRGSPELYRLFVHRFPKDGDNDELLRELDSMVSGAHALVADVPGPLRQVVRTHLRMFREGLPEGFDLRVGSIGNFVLVGGYLNNEHDLESVVYLFSKLVEVRGLVRATVTDDLHLAATLEDGTRIVGQHRLTGKTEAPIASPVDSLELVTSLDEPKPATSAISNSVRKLIVGADLVCYPMGSFYSSVVANLLPSGVGRAIREARCPKLYVPNTGRDPEQVHMSLSGSLEVLARHVRTDAGEATSMSDIVNFVLVDRRRGDYSLKLDLDRVRDMGVEVLDQELVSEQSAPRIERELLSNVLLSMA